MDHATTPSPQTPLKQERGSSSYLAVFAVTLSLLSIAVAGFSLEALRSQNEQPMEDQAGRVALKSQQARIAKLEQALAEANRSMDSLKAEWQEREDAPEDTASAEAMEASISAVKDELSASQDAIAQDIARIDSRIGELAQTKQNADVRLVYGVLRARIESGKPYSDALALLEQALDNTPQEQDLSPLATHGAEGIATPGKLYADLQAIRIEPADIAPAAIPEEGSWWQQARASLAGVIKVERIEGTIAPEGAYQQILAIVKLGDIAAARSAILNLPSRDQRPYEAWLDASKARIDVLDALDALAPAVLSSAADTQAAPEEAPAEPTPASPPASEE